MKITDYLATILELPGCIADSETPDEALKEFENSKDMPNPKKYSGQLRVVGAPKAVTNNQSLKTKKT